MSIETWKSIKGYEGIYEVSNQGKVRSLNRMNPCNAGEKRRSFLQCLTGVTLKPTLCSSGYLGVSLKRGSKNKTATIHSLVAKAFIPNPENFPQVNHIDGNKLNNVVVNLEWCSHSQNMKHAADNGLMAHNRGELAGGVKLRENDIFDIRKLLKGGLSQRKIAGIYGVAQRTIGCINTRDTWGHI